MDKLEFPVATCPYCKIRGPVIIEDMGVILPDEFDEVASADVIVCPECVRIINNDNDVEIEWFDFDDAQYFGYKVVMNDEGTGTD